MIFQLKYNTCAFKVYAELAGKYRKSPRAENQDLETQSGKPIGELQLPGAFAHVGSPKAGDFTATRRSEDKALQGGNQDAHQKSKTTQLQPALAKGGDKKT